jgi:hypothetical protein
MSTSVARFYGLRLSAITAIFGAVTTIGGSFFIVAKGFYIRSIELTLLFPLSYFNHYTPKPGFICSTLNPFDIAIAQFRGENIAPRITKVLRQWQYRGCNIAKQSAITLVAIFLPSLYAIAVYHFFRSQWNCSMDNYSRKPQFIPLLCNAKINSTVFCIYVCLLYLLKIINIIFDYIYTNILMKMMIKIYIIVAVGFTVLGCNSSIKLPETENKEAVKVTVDSNSKEKLPKTLKIGIYGREGKFYSRSWAQIARSQNRYCIEAAEGQAPPHADAINIHTLSVSHIDGKFIIDKTKEIVETSENNELLGMSDDGLNWKGESNNYSDNLIECLKTNKVYAKGNCLWRDGLNETGRTKEQLIKECEENLDESLERLFND